MAANVHFRRTWSFHAVYWAGLLMSADRAAKDGLGPASCHPRREYVEERGNVVEPFACGDLRIDALRYFLFRESLSAG